MKCFHGGQWIAISTTTKYAVLASKWTNIRKLYCYEIATNFVTVVVWSATRTTGCPNKLDGDTLQPVLVYLRPGATYAISARLPRPSFANTMCFISLTVNWNRPHKRKFSAIIGDGYRRLRICTVMRMKHLEIELSKDWWCGAEIKAKESVAGTLI